MDASKRIESLERSVRRLQRGVLGLAALLAGCVTVAAVPNELTIRGLNIVDSTSSRPQHPRRTELP